MKNIPILDLFDFYKTEPTKLLDALRSHLDLKIKLAAIMNNASHIPDWPSELQNGDVVMFGLLANDIGGIASPELRARAADQLFEIAESYGLRATSIRMIAAEIHPVRQALEAVVIEVPQDLMTDSIEGGTSGGYR